MGVFAGSVLARSMLVGAGIGRNQAAVVLDETAPLQSKRKKTPVKLEVWHNILWSNYKAGVFSQMARQCDARNIDLSVIQIAETESDRVGLAAVDLSRHKYPMTLLFNGTYSGVPTWKLMWEGARRALTTKADLVVLAGYHRPEYITQAVVLWLRRKPRAVFCDSTAYDRPQVWWKNAVKRASFWLCDYVFCYGERAQEYVQGLGVPKDHTFLRCQAAALPDNYDPDAVAAQRLAHAPADGKALFVYVGRLSPEKRLDVLIKAFTQAIANGTPGLVGARLRLVGNGPQRPALEALAAQLGVAESVEFTGGQSKEQLYANYSAATAMVLPSHSEPWGLVVNEALHYGCPVIVSERCGCVPELVANSDCGMAVPCDDVPAMTAALEAAPALWADREAIAACCLKRIAPFFPASAADAILDGVAQIVKIKTGGDQAGR